jgi:hypothetical protein
MMSLMMCGDLFRNFVPQTERQHSHLIWLYTCSLEDVTACVGQLAGRKYPCKTEVGDALDGAKRTIKLYSFVGGQLLGSTCDHVKMPEALSSLMSLGAVSPMATVVCFRAMATHYSASRKYPELARHMNVESGFFSEFGDALDKVGDKEMRNLNLLLVETCFSNLLASVAPDKAAKVSAAGH